MKLARPGRSAVLSVLAAALLAGCNKPAPAAGEAAAPPAAASTTAASLTQQPALGAGHESLPRIATPLDVNTNRINAALAALDANWKESVDQCTGGDKAISRETAVARNASGFLAVSMAYEASCGGAYPASGTEYQTYDLTTGALADWSKLLPKAGIVNGESDPEYPSNSFASAALQARLAQVAEANAGADPEWKDGCGTVYAMEDLTLQADFDPEKPVLRISPGALPHVAQACGDSLELKVDDLKALGAPERLIAAVKAVGR